MNEASDFTHDIFMQYISYVTYALIGWAETNYFLAMAILVFIGSIISMTPLSIMETQRESVSSPNIGTHASMVARKIIIVLGFALFALPLIIVYGYDSVHSYSGEDNVAIILSWMYGILVSTGWIVPLALVAGHSIRFISKRYIHALWSKLNRYMRFEQSQDKLNDIQDVVGQFKSKNYPPQKYYDLENSIFLGLDTDNKPLYVSRETWLEVNMQIIGPTRYGKGVLAGSIADQTIRHGDGLFYIAPKVEKHLPHIMCNAAEQCGRKFYYLDLNDTGPGTWGPFLGGRDKDVLARMFSTLELEMTGDAATDYYKAIEREELAKVYKNGRSIQALLSNLDHEKTTRATATLKNWAYHDTFNCKSGKGFSIKKALLENAVVYVQGSLNDSVVKSATKCFINELVIESAQLEAERASHLTIFVDEVRFLVSRELTNALATIVGFNVNIITMYQSILDLLAPDDNNLNGHSVLQSVNSNSQLKAVYGGADSETARWVSELSGETVMQVSKLEKTRVNEAGAEIWAKERSLGAENQSLIHSNVVKTLPPRVCVLFRPMHLTKVAFTSFVEVKTENNLKNFLERMSSRSDAIKKQQADSTPQKAEKAEKAEKPDNKSRSKKKNVHSIASKGKPEKTKQKQKKENANKGQDTEAAKKVALATNGD